MKLAKQHIKDIAAIMGLPKGLTRNLIKFLPKISVLEKPLSPLRTSIYKETFKILNLKKGMRVLDLACGQGSISIPLVLKYKVYVDGYDILAGFIEYARKKAQKKQVAHLCQFAVKDVRKVLRQAKNYDVVLWFSPPHLWKTPKETIKHLRHYCKDGRYIVINDAYLYPNAPDTKDYKTYEMFAKMNKDFTSFGDSILKVFDYKGADWEYDYKRDKREIKKMIKRIKNSRTKKLLNDYLKYLEKSEQKDTKNLGCAVWVIKINKQAR